MQHDNGSLYTNTYIHILHLHSRSHVRCIFMLHSIGFIKIKMLIISQHAAAA
jgi:hypothetical protein